MPTTDDQRTAPRYEVDVPVTGVVEGESFAGRLHDVSISGAAIVTDVDFGYRNDQFVNLHMEVLGGRDAVIRRKIPGGFAVQFMDNDETDAEREKKIAALAAFRALGRKGREA